MAEQILVQGVNAAAGRSTIALNLAFELAGTGSRVCLVDLDASWPSLHRQLAVNQQQAAVLAACRFLQQGKLDANAFDSVSSRIVAKGASIDFLSGYGLDQAQSLLSAETLRLLLQFLGQKFDTVIVDTAPAQAGWRRAAINGVIFEATDGWATHGITVTLSDSLSLARHIEEQDQLLATPKSTLVVNRFRASALGSRPQAQLQDVLRNGTAHNSAALIPEDAAFDEALLAGVPLRQITTKAAGFKALAELARGLRE